MSAYLLLKWLHIVSSVVLVGVGFGSAFYLYFIHRTRNVTAIAEVLRLVVRADYWFTSPAVVIQPVTGIAMASIAGYSLLEPWLVATWALFAVAGACWLPVVWLQIRMAAMARAAADNGADLGPQYWRYARIWERLGMVAFPAVLAIYGLMVFKPA
ncbi:hypothetical protein MIZ01_2591 [Sideroxyarcus emersonii]|uniref:DUF2269 domain-containing protein n=1 Tax=Sideroxyarcus emersonii TaxID=2764705 RepID=A0AAN1XCB5_9PROT|nr:DUF2269 domain-containing protein [Sideroxyarcus emersonii]BCK88785.1 hypothetical protein MIZ01_2591 [Sideroxyarcus emersonii]